MSAGLLVSNNGSAADYIPIVMGGIDFYTGKASKSLGGSKGYFLSLRDEKKKGFFRPKSAAELHFASGDLTLSSTKYPFSMYAAAFQYGANIFVFKEGQIQPYFGLHGHLGANYMQLTTTSTTVEANSLGLGFGYELNAGCDIRFGSSDGAALRVEGAYSSVGSSLAGQSLRLDGFKLSIGKTW